VPVIPAAGTVPWRRRRGTLQVALVHRPRYDDWSWSKGKLDPEEEWPVAAVRETLEETGLKVRLGRPLPPAAYIVLDRTARMATKEVRYWAAEVVGGSGRLENEIDEVAWLDVATAYSRIDYARDRDQLRALVRADQTGGLTTWPIVLVRHAKAIPREAWKGDDQLRPLDSRGIERADALAKMLAAYGVTRLVSSPSVRCSETLRPYAAQLGLPLKLKEGLSEEGFADNPLRAPRHLRRLLERGAAAAVCSHGPVLPDLLDILAGLVEADGPQAEEASRHLKTASADTMSKGEALVVHIVGTGSDAHVVAVERYQP
jgi:8-oxo-(d)GTP phosphatase